MNEIPLYKLKPGDSGVIVRMEEGTLQRLRDLGMIPETRVKCLHKSPLKDPAAYEVRGAVLALRKKDCIGIMVEPDLPEDPDSELTIALAGNPNVGKSTIFNTLTGLRQHTGNWAGKTVGTAEGVWKLRADNTEIRVVDLPGCYSLRAASPEEEVTRNYLQSDQYDGVVIICDGTCLERNLILVLQILQMTSRAAVCINMMDQVRKRGLEIDREKLQELLGVPVCMTESCRPKEVRKNLEILLQDGWPNGDSGGWRGDIQDSPAPDCGSNCENEEALVHRAEEIADQVICRKQEKPDVSRHIDRILTSPVTGFPIMACLLLAVFWLTIKGANYPSEALSRLLFSLEQPLYDLLYTGLHLPSVICEMLACGMYRVLAWVVSVMLPPMAIFFPLFTLLEDWGFLPRAAFNLDRCFQCCSACGRQALTLCMGFGCNASAVMGCRIIESERERLLAILTNCLTPCNGRFPMLICLLTLFFIGDGHSGGGFRAALLLTAVVCFSIAMTLLLSKILSLTLLRGRSSSFILELPPFRKPQLGKVIVRSVLDRTLFVLARAAAVAAPAGLVIWLLANVPVGDVSLLSVMADSLDPLGRLLGMDGVILLSFLLGFPASEIVLPVMLMIYMNQTTLTEITDWTFFHQLLTENGWTALTAVNVILFSLMHWPCAATLLTIRKETASWKWTLAAVLAPLALGCIFCGVSTAVYCKFL